MGIFQALAIIPSISRSGATIGIGLFRGVKKEQVVRFSFLLAVPIILGATIIDIPELQAANIPYNILIISFFVTLITSILTIKFLIKIIYKDNFYLFGIYNFLLGILILILNYI